MIQKLLFPETLGQEKFDVTKADLTVADLVEQYKKQEAFEFESQKKYRFILIKFSRILRIHYPIDFYTFKRFKYNFWPLQKHEINVLILTSK